MCAYTVGNPLAKARGLSLRTLITETDVDYLNRKYLCIFVFSNQRATSNNHVRDLQKNDMDSNVMINPLVQSPTCMETFITDVTFLRMTSLVSAFSK